MRMPYRLQHTIAYRAALSYAAMSDSKEEIVSTARLVGEEDNEAVASYLQSKGWKIRFSHDEYRVLNTPEAKRIPECKRLTLGEDVDALHPVYGWVQVEVADLSNGEMLTVEIPSKDFEEFQVHELDIALLNTHTDPFG